VDARERRRAGRDTGGDECGRADPARAARERRLDPRREQQVAASMMPAAPDSSASFAARDSSRTE